MAVLFFRHRGLSAVVISIASAISCAANAGPARRELRTVTRPSLDFSSYLGGSQFEMLAGIAVDDQGRAFVTGTTTSIDYPLARPVQPVAGGDGDVFLTQLDALGRRLEFSSYLGGVGTDRGGSVSLCPDGSVVVAGSTSSRDFPLVRPVQATLRGIDAFVMRLDPSLTNIVFSTFFGGSGDERALATCGRDGSIVLYGSTSSTDLPLLNPLQPGFGGITDAFVARFSAEGGLRFSGYLGGRGSDFAGGVALDDGGDIYLTGAAGADDFPIVNALQPRFGGREFDGFVARLAGDGSSLRWSTFLGGTAHDAGTAIALGYDGSVYVGGSTASDDFPLADPLASAPAGNFEAFLSRIDGSGSSLLFSSYVGGSAFDQTIALATGAGYVVLVGETQSRDFPLLEPFQSSYGGGDFDAFVTVFTQPQPRLVLSTYLGAERADRPSGIAVSACGDVWVAGDTTSESFPLVQPLQTALKGFTDGVLARFPMPPKAPCSPRSASSARTPPKS